MMQISATACICIQPRELEHQTHLEDVFAVWATLHEEIAGGRQVSADEACSERRRLSSFWWHRDGFWVGVIKRYNKSDGLLMKSTGRISCNPVLIPFLATQLP